MRRYAASAPASAAALVQGKAAGRTDLAHSTLEDKEKSLMRLKAIARSGMSGHRPYVDASKKQEALV